MPIISVSFANTLAQWMTRTNEMIVTVNDLLNDGLLTFRSVTANVIASNSSFVSSIDLGSSLNTSFTRANQANATANTALLISPNAFDRANISNTTANISIAISPSAFNRANLANATANISFVTNPSAFDRANLANASANTALNTCLAADNRSNMAINSANTALSLSIFAFNQANLANLIANTITGANVGSGVGIFKERVGSNLQFRNISTQKTTSGSGTMVSDINIAIVENTSNITLSLSVTYASDSL